MLLVVLLLAGFALVVQAAQEDEFAAVIAAVHAFNQTHGGQGELQAEIQGFPDFAWVAITGDVTSATRGIQLPHARIRWQARLHGNSAAGEALITAYNLEIAQGADILTNGIAVRMLENETYGRLTMWDGKIVGDIYSDRWILAQGGNIAGSLFGGRSVTITGDAVVNAYQVVLFRGSFEVEDNATVYIENVDALRNRQVLIKPTATTNFEDRLTDYIRAEILGNAGWIQWVTKTIVGNVIIEGNQRVGPTTLVIPADSSLVITGNLYLYGDGTLVLDGTLHVQGRVVWRGLANVSGSRLWQLQPAWIQFILRWIFFGWIWMS